ncbi:fatty aldehyde dehydrogenase variant form, putative [Trichomonas vaginalis G3]|uniref:Aldehyde dehydrogenase n=1 Tax=Trichomonas vaginalis (strain ATCC PRA-98 / G3) TaxID=412133 RepID=A2FBP0_TRIV3|nr:aldehyde dehydrogenase family [Trichomonas vaginalis G3]EAX97677.1 fatty aldehyde dehydrogenase variant form, putative [Trichomonas vaginalis G3]KAI5486326.1 aldehyde dehydrogenase family [Trichomonas vaginalis G3]|eukprot:XP_001310607.1 fatty aldehyde dehydrogenase variant form [Trichomonas vaginalis G3]
MEPVPVPPEEIPTIVKELREHFKTRVSFDFKWREDQLNGLLKCLDEHKDDWVKAMYDDMGSHHFEAELLIENVKTDISHTLKKFKSWLAPQSCSVAWALTPGSASIVPEPYGVVCDFIPYNYPMYLGFATLCPILAAGNVCLFKPSSNTPHCAKLYQTLFPQYLDPKGVRVVCGPTRICDVILDQRFDFIFYTGSPAVAKNVMRHAAEHLTPCLLELGGKSPVYFDKNCSLAKSVRRLIWGKIFNGGQTCVCPDYVMVHKDIMEQFKAEMVKAINELYPNPDTAYNDNITHIISKHHFDRLTKLIDNSGGNIIIKGFQDPEKLFIGPTLIENPSMEADIMTTEVFGPVIPFFPVDNEDKAIEFINEREKPLAAYVFTSDWNVFTKFQQQTSSGALMQNDVVFHVSSPYSPFGGVGNSGMGQYHGEIGVKTLSHLKPILTHSTMVEIPFKFPPYSDRNLSILRKFA